MTEPTVVTGAISELVRQVLPALVVLGVVSFTDVQLAAIFMVVSASIAFLNVLVSRSQVVPVERANEQIQAGISASPGTTVEEVIRRVG